MLSHLHISHYALIDSLDIDLESGLTALTGETGAGKSIIMGALGLLLGNRADARAIKAGARKCCVEAAFRTAGTELAGLLAEIGVDDEPGECLLRREVSAAGKSRAFINDTPVQLSALREVGARLVDIHSQHQNLLLQREDFLLATLDAFGGHDDRRQAYGQTYDAWNTARAELDSLRRESERNDEETDYVRFRLQELEAAGLAEGEQEELEAEARLLEHAEEIKAALYAAGHALDGEERDTLGALGQARASLEGIAGALPGAGELARRIESARIELADIADETRRALEATDFDPARLDYVSQRLDTLYGLQKKFHAADTGQLLAEAERLRRKLDHAESHGERLAEAEKRLGEARRRLDKAAAALTAARHEAAQRLAATLAERLRPLGMPSAELRIDFTTRPQPAPTGPESAALLFSANAGSPLRDAADVASGGEVARLMLALKSLMADRRGQPTVIFDEIDTGVSGTMAGRMGELMRAMGRSRQVICITHLPQIAALADVHYRVYKTENEGQTTSHIARLSPDGREREIAAMLSGEALTRAALDNARSLLAGAAEPTESTTDPA